VQQANTLSPGAARWSADFGRRHGRALLRATVTALGFVALWSFVIQPLTGHFSGQFEDFQAYIGAARDMAAGRSPYTSFDGGASVVMSGFDYPPFGAVLVRPLALLSDRWAMTLWLWMGLACTVAGAIVVARTALPERWPRTEIGLLFALGFCPATYNYWHGQMNPVIFLLLALAFRSWVRGRELSTGVLLGLAAGIKLAPAVLIVVMLRRHWWRGSLAMAATGLGSVAAAVALLGTDVTGRFVHGVLPSLTRETGWIYNQSLSGVLSRAGDHSVIDIQPPSQLLHVLSLLGSVALLGVAAWCVRPGRRDAADRGAEFGVAILAMLLAGTIAWFPHFTHLLIPLAAAGGVVAARGWHRSRWLLAATGAVLLLFEIALPAALGAIQDLDALHAFQRTGAWWPAIQLFSLPVLAVVALLVTMARAARGPARA
jgi:alpha-1,2-mannosyltransferase